jgi:NRAMP (natural resistance-associated macrophage protein)-like metal ion transporter
LFHSNDFPGKIQNNRYIRKPVMRSKFHSIGPAALVTAAFIGPGTVTACTLAGAGHGYALLWALLFSVIATMVLQEMAARLGIVARKDLGEALHAQFPRGIGRVVSILLVISAIAIGIKSATC